MKKNILKNKLQDGFLETAPDVYEAVLTAAGKNKFALQNEESKKMENSGRSHLYFRSFTKYALSACAGFALFFVCLFGMLGKNQDNIYVVIDINPSVQIIMNDSYQVKKIQGLNQDGRDVIRTLRWNKKDPILQTVERVVECAVEEDYLHDGGAILVTLSAANRDMYDGLEDEMGTSIDGKLRKMGVSRVTTAFQCAEESSGEEGRELLEAELAEKYGINEEKLQQMSVSELIQCCQKYEAEKLQLSPVSEKQKEASDKKEGLQDKKESQKKKQTDDKTEKVNNSGKTNSDAVDEDDKAEDKQPEKGKPQNSKSQPDVSSQENQYNPGSEESMQQEPIPSSETEPSTVPVTQPEETVPSPQDPPKDQENPPKEEDGSEADGKPEEDKGKNKNNGKKNENSGKDNNNKDNSNKKNNKKDNNGKDNNKENDNKNNGNKDNDNKENDNKEKSEQEDGGKGGNSKNNNKDESAKDISISCEEGITLELRRD